MGGLLAREWAVVLAWAEAERGDWGGLRARTEGIVFLLLFFVFFFLFQKPFQTVKNQFESISTLLEITQYKTINAPA